MIPIRDENPQLRTPIVTFVLIGLNLASWFLLQGFGAYPALDASVCKLGLIPASLFEFAGTVRQGCPVDTWSGWPGFLTSMFSHGSWMHLAGNLWFLWIFGDNVEDSMGRVRFAIFYLLCGFAAAAAQVLAEPQSTIPMVGASGAIGGVMGAYIVLYPRVHVYLFAYFATFAVPAFMMLGYWFLVQLLGGYNSIGVEGGGVAFWAHLGGFVAGAVLVLLFRDPKLLEAHPYHGWRQRRHRDAAWHDVSSRRRR